MNFDKDYKEFISFISDNDKCGTAGPVELTREEDVTVRLFVSYLNCRYEGIRDLKKHGNPECNCEEMYEETKYAHADGSIEEWSCPAHGYKRVE